MGGGPRAIADEEDEGRLVAVRGEDDRVPAEPGRDGGRPPVVAATTASTLPLAMASCDLGARDVHDRDVAKAHPVQVEEPAQVELRGRPADDADPFAFQVGDRRRSPGPAGR